jgi:hypothetical protein
LTVTLTRLIGVTVGIALFDFMVIFVWPETSTRKAFVKMELASLRCLAWTSKSLERISPDKAAKEEEERRRRKREGLRIHSRAQSVWNKLKDYDRFASNAQSEFCLFRSKMRPHRAFFFPMRGWMKLILIKGERGRSSLFPNDELAEMKRVVRLIVVKTLVVYFLRRSEPREWGELYDYDENDGSGGKEEGGVAPRDVVTVQLSKAFEKAVAKVKEEVLTAFDFDYIIGERVRRQTSTTTEETAAASNNNNNNNSNDIDAQVAVQEEEELPPAKITAKEAVAEARSALRSWQRVKEDCSLYRDTVSPHNHTSCSRVERKATIGLVIYNLLADLDNLANAAISLRARLSQSEVYFV